MSNFTPLVKREYEFDGDVIQVTFARLNRKDMVNVLPSFIKIKNAEKESDLFLEGINDVLNDLADLIPIYVKTFEGLNDAEGNVITIETVVNEMYFSKLSTMIAMDLIKESGVPSGEA